METIHQFPIKPYDDKVIYQKELGFFSLSFLFCGRFHYGSAQFLMINPFLKVSEFENQFFLFSFHPKNERNYFLIFALASKMT